MSISKVLQVFLTNIFCYLVLLVDYRKWSLPRTEKISHDPGYRPPTAPFKGDSNYHDDYIRHSVAPRQSMKPVENAKLSDQPLEKDTDYRQSYIRHPLPPKEVREKPKFEPNNSKLEGLSNYMKDYTPKDFSRQSLCKPNPKPYQSEAPFEGDTTQKVDYKAWPTERMYVREPEHWVKPDGDFDMNTTTHTDYTKKPIERSQMKKPEAQRKVPGRFDDHTNYKQDFRKWTPVERPKVTMKSEYMAPEAPFKGESNYQTDYIKKSQALRSSMKPIENSQRSEQPFDGQTGYREEYIKHPLQERQQKEKPQWEPNHSKLDGLSNYMKDYINKDIPKVASCKPDVGAYQSTAPFEGDTTQRTDFKQWPAQRPWVKEPDQWVKPDGDMMMDTTTHTDYTRKPIERPKLKKPDSGRKMPGKFDGNTHYKEDFRKWTPGERAMPKPKSDYNPPEAPFQGNSNYHDDYIKHQMAPTRSLKPADKGYSSGAPLDDNTEYRDEYIKKAAPECPAVIIEKFPPMKSGYMFENQDPQGHKWYAPVTTSTQLPKAVRGSSPKQMAVSVA